MTVPVVKRKRDWFRIVRALNRAGISAAKIARECGRHAGAVKHWCAGGEPKESDARIVLALLAKHAPDAYTLDQQEFGIRVEIERSIRPGDQLGLTFVEVK